MTRWLNTNYTTMILENSEDIEKEQEILALMASYRVAGISDGSGE